MEERWKVEEAEKARREAEEHQRFKEAHRVDVRRGPLVSYFSLIFPFLSLLPASVLLPCFYFHFQF